MRLLAEYDESDDLLAAIRAMRGRDYRRLEAYTPYPVHGIDDALGSRPSPIGFVVFAAGMTGAGGAYFLQWLLNAELYPLNVGGRPPHFPMSFVPITFEMGVLVAGITAVVSVLVAGRLVKLWDPVFEAEGFESASETKFWLEVRSSDPRFDRERTEAHLRATGARRVVSVEDPG